MTQEHDHPITPPPELVQEWTNNDDFQFSTGTFDLVSITKDRLNSIATQAARWGADQELEACCRYISRWFATPEYRAAELRAARRPKPPSLKEQALAELDLLKGDANAHGLGFDAPAIRRALEALPDEP